MGGPGLRPLRSESRPEPGPSWSGRAPRPTAAAWRSATSLTEVGGPPIGIVGGSASWVVAQKILRRSESFDIASGVPSDGAVILSRYSADKGHRKIF